MGGLPLIPRFLGDAHRPSACGGGPGRRHALVVVLGYSRMLWLQYYERQTMETVVRGLEAAFAFFGGVPSELLFDQMRAVVVGDHRREGGRLLENREFLRFSAHWGFRIRACRAGRAQTKGKVERPISYVRSSFFYGREFVSDDHAGSARRQRGGPRRVHVAHGNRSASFGAADSRGGSPPGNTHLGTRLRSLRSLRSGPQMCAIFNGQECAVFGGLTLRRPRRRSRTVRGRSLRLRSRAGTARGASTSTRRCKGDQAAGPPPRSGRCCPDRSVAII